jgi:hypothetical protein
MQSSGPQWFTETLKHIKLNRIRRLPSGLASE